MSAPIDCDSIRFTKLALLLQYDGSNSMASLLHDHQQREVIFAFAFLLQAQHAERPYRFCRSRLRIVWWRMQAFYLARTGRPGPVLIDVPKDVQQQMAVPDWGRAHGNRRLHGPPAPAPHPQGPRSSPAGTERGAVHLCPGHSRSLVATAWEGVCKGRLSFGTTCSVCKASTHMWSA